MWTAKTVPAEVKPTSTPASAGPARPATDSAVLVTPFAPWTSVATRTTVLATPGWNIAAAVPLITATIAISHSRTVWVRKRKATADCEQTRTRSAPIISARALKRSAKTPPKMTNPAKQAVEAAITRPMSPAE